MLNIELDDEELERFVHERFGGNNQAVARAFLAFLRNEQIAQDVEVSISQLEAREGIPMETVMGETRQRYQ